MSRVSLILRAKSNKDGRYQVLIMVNHQNHTFRYSLPFSMTQKEWEKRNTAEYRQCIALQSRVQLLMDNLFLDGRLGEIKTDDLGTMIRNAIGLKSASVSNDLLRTYMLSFADKKSAQRTKELYQATISNIGKYTDISKLSAHKIDADWIERWEIWMRDHGLATNTRAIHLRNLRAVLNDLYKKNIIKDYPFKAYSIKREETRHRILTIEQIRTLANYHIDDDKKRLYRDLWMLELYLIGINSVDLFSAKKTQIINGRLEYRRHKTGRLYSIKIEPEAQEIIDRYQGNEHLLYVAEKYKSLHDFCRRWCDCLNTLGTGSRQGKKGNKAPLLPHGVTPYWSRHSWATIAFNECDVPKDAVSLALGHSFGVSVTDIYISYTNKIVDAANRAVIDAILGSNVKK